MIGKATFSPWLWLIVIGVTGVVAVVQAF